MQRDKENGGTNQDITEQRIEVLCLVSGDATATSGFEAILCGLFYWVALYDASVERHVEGLYDERDGILTDGLVHVRVDLIWSLALSRVE